MMRFASPPSALCRSTFLSPSPLPRWHQINNKFNGNGRLCRTTQRESSSSSSSAHPAISFAPPPTVIDMFSKSFWEVYRCRKETNVIIRHFAEREFKNRLPAELLLWALAGANVAVFFTLRTKEYDEEFFYNNFTCNGFNLKEGRYHTLLTSSFGQRNIEGLLIDLGILAGFATKFRVSARLRAWKLLVLYLGSGACGSFAESYRPAIYSSFASKESQQLKMYRPCFDSSASIYAIVVYSLGLGFHIEGTLRKAAMSFIAFGLVFLLRSCKEDLLGDNGMWQRDLVAAGMGWYFHYLWPFSF